MYLREDESVKVKIKQISGRESIYDAWSVTADVCVESEEKGEFCDRRVTMNVLKDDGNLEECEEGCPTVVKRIRDEFLNIIKEDPEYQSYSVDSLEKEKSKVDDLEDSEYRL